MKVVLLKDVKNVGKKNDTKIIADGFAINSLIPQGLAELATPKAIARIELVKKQEEDEKKIKENLLVKNLKSIHDVEVEFITEANEKGHLFAGIHKDEIAKIVKEKTEVDILPEFIILEKPIKEIGTHVIDIKVQGKQAAFKLVIKAQ
jgi:large subunit ribosomal protein L9